MSNEKTCKGCGETKPVDEFQKTGKLYKDGTPKYYGKCKSCMNAYRRTYNATNPDKRAKFAELTRAWKKENKEKVSEYYKEYAKANREKANENQKRWRDKSQYAKKRWAEKKVKGGIKDNRKGPENDATRTCGVCGETKPTDEFARDRFDEGRGYLWRTFTCRSCENAYQVAYKLANPDKKEIFRQCHVNWTKKNRDKVNEHSRRRTLRRKNVGGSHTVAEWEALKAATGNKCLCCGVSGDETELTRDHVLPITKGGTDNIDNIQPLCKSCNSRKHTNHIDYRSTT